MSQVMQHKSRSRKQKNTQVYKNDESISTQNGTVSPDTSLNLHHPQQFKVRHESPASLLSNSDKNLILPSLKSNKKLSQGFRSQVNSSRNLNQNVLAKWDESPIKPDNLLQQAEQQIKSQRLKKAHLRALPQSPYSSNEDEDCQSSDFSIDLFDNQQKQQQNSIKRKRKLKKLQSSSQQDLLKLSSNKSQSYKQQVSSSKELTSKVSKLFCNVNNNNYDDLSDNNVQSKRKNIAQKIFSNNVSTPQPKTSKQLLQEINEIEAQKLKSSQKTIFQRLDDRNEKFARKHHVAHSLVLNTEPTAQIQDFNTSKPVVVENLNLVAIQRKRRNQKFPTSSTNVSYRTEGNSSRKNSICNSSASEYNLDKIKGCLKPRNVGFSQQRKKSVFFDQKARLIDPKAGIIESVDTKNSSQQNWKIQKTFYGKKLFNQKI